MALPRVVLRFLAFSELPALSSHYFLQNTPIYQLLSLYKWLLSKIVLSWIVLIFSGILIAEKKYNYSKG